MNSSSFASVSHKKHLIFCRDTETAAAVELDECLLGFVNPGRLNLVQQRYDTLIDYLLARKVAIKMFQSDALSFRELEAIIRCRSLSNAAKTLLDILLQLPDDAISVFDCFLEALKSTNQEHIFLWVSYPSKLRVSTFF
jgi:hypothetical protein